MTELTLKLIIILIPGALGAIIFGKLVYHKEWTPFVYTLNSIIIGIFGYLFLQIGVSCRTFINNKFLCDKTGDYRILSIWNSISDSKLIPFKEIIGASVICIILGFISAFIDSRKLINRTAQSLKISRKYGDENLFSTFLADKDTEFVYVRSIKNNLTYLGWLHSFSENETVSEIVLKDVKVYNYSESEFLYDVEKIYLSFSKVEIIIEYAKINQ